jgi:hypothetical protein
MSTSAAQAILERVVTGERCDVFGCYELAVWLVCYGKETSHWCPKHTRIQMRDSGRW